MITEGIPKADLAVTITSPSGHRVKAEVIPTAEGFLVNFTPTQLGEYLLSVSFGGTPITQYPFRIKCLVGCDSRKVSAEGPGLTHGIIGRPAQFIIDTRGAGQGGLGVTVEGPCEAAINCRDNGDGTCNVAYLPTEAGDYTINITFNDKHITGSPFQAIITPEPDLSQIKVSGLGIQSHGKASILIWMSCWLRPPPNDFVCMMIALIFFIIIIFAIPNFPPPHGLHMEFTIFFRYFRCYHECPN